MTTTTTTLPFLNRWTLDTEKIPEYPEFCDELVEQIDRKLGFSFLETDDPRVPPESKELFRTTVLANLVGDQLKVKYENRKGLGRVYANFDIGLTPQSRYIKNTIYAYHGWRDIDMRKSYPNIILSLADNNGRTLPAYEYYLNNFDTIVADLISYYSKEGQPPLVKDQVKWLFSMIIFGGGYSTWKHELEHPKKKDIAKGYKPVIIEDKPLPYYVEDFKFETEQIIGIIDRSNPDLRTKLWDSHKSRYENTNSLMSYYLGAIENHILYNSMMYLKSEGIISTPNLSLAYDGKTIPPFKVDKSDEAIMSGLNDHIHTLTGLGRVEFIFKEFDPSTILTHLIEKRCAMDAVIEIQHPEPGLVAAANEASPEDKYLLWKQEFEKTHCKIVNRSFFIKCIKDDKGFIVEFKIFDKTSLVTSYENITYDEPKEKKDGSMTTVKKSCIKKWLVDESMRLYEDMNIVPPPLVCPVNVFNLWTPFYAQQLEPSATVLNDDNRQEYIDKCAMIIDHIKILCNHDEDDSRFMLRWIGQLLKHPAIKTFAPTLISEEGAGKGTLIYLLQRMLGKSKVFETTDPAKYVWGNFNELMQDAFLVNCDEMDYKAQQECDGKIKGLITNNNLTINPKGVKSFRIQSYHRFIYTTNNEVPIKTHKKDRRNKIIRSSDEKIGDGEYFKKLREYIDDDIVIRMLFEFWVAQDVDSFHLEVITQNKYQQALSDYAVPIPEQFLEHITREYAGDDSKEFTSQDLYNKFLEWKVANEIKYECDSAKLLRNLQLLQIPNWFEKKRTRTERNTLINFDVLRSHFNIGLNPKLADEVAGDDTDIEIVEDY